MVSFSQEAHGGLIMTETNLTNLDIFFISLACGFLGLWIYGVVRSRARTKAARAFEKSCREYEKDVSK